jgi:hypothetical protein
MTISELLQNAKSLQEGMHGALIRETLRPMENEILEQQRIQLLEGKDSSGKDIHPFYSEDIKPRGYFRTNDAAKRYADWKQTISYPYSVQRNPDAPNLYITGVFHDDLGLTFEADYVMVVPDTSYAAQIMNKYKVNAFGLSMEKWGVIFNEKGAKDELLKRMKQVLWQ